MTVYCDDMARPYGRMIMCHMVADTTEELLEMAHDIGVSSRHIQYAGTPQEHFDICLTMKRKALGLGAQPITAKELVAILRRKRRKEETP